MDWAEIIAADLLKAMNPRPYLNPAQLLDHTKSIAYELRNAYMKGLSEAIKPKPIKGNP